MHHFLRYELHYSLKGIQLLLSQVKWRKNGCEKEAIPDEYQTLYGDKKEEPEHYFFPAVRAHGSGIDMLSACVKKSGYFIRQSSAVIKHRRVDDVSI